MLCNICNQNEATIEHHTQYYPEKTMRVCTGCHGKIHSNNTPYPNLVPERPRPPNYGQAHDSHGRIFGIGTDIVSVPVSSCHCRRCHAGTRIYYGLCNDCWKSWHVLDTPRPTPTSDEFLIGVIGIGD